MDLVGPIGSRESGHVAHKEPLHLLAITDPFSHMVWIERITCKSAEEVYTKFSEGFLLKEGAPLCSVHLDRQRKGVRQQATQGAASVVGDSFISHAGLSSSWELHRTSQQVHR